MAEVFFDPNVGGDGSTVTDDANPDTGLANGGHRLRFVPSLAQVVAVAAFVVQKAADAAAAAASALGGTGSIATSTTSLTITSGADIALDVGTGKTFAAGQKVGVARTSAPTTSAMYGTVKTYSGSTLTVTIATGDFIGSGTFSDWTVSPTLYGPPSARTISAGGLATGGGDLSANRTITVTAATVADIWAGTATDKVIHPKVQSDANAFQVLTYGATTNWDTNAKGYNSIVTLTGDTIMGAPTNLKDGWPYTQMVKQDATGGRVVTSWNAIFDWGALGPPVLSTGANKVDIWSGIYSSITGKIHVNFRGAA